MNIQKWDLIQFIRGVGVYIGPERPFVHMMRIGPGQLELIAEKSLDFICLSEGLSEQILDAWSKLKLGGRLVVWATLEGAVNVPETLRAECWDWVWHDEDDTHFMQAFVRRSRADDSRLEKIPARPPLCAAVVRPAGKDVGYGDAIWTSSVIAQLHSMGYHVTVYTDTAGEEALRHDPHIDRFIVDSYLIAGADDIPKYWEHEMGRYDRWINLCQAVETNLLVTPAQLSSLWPQAARHARCNENYLETLHAVAGLPYVPAQKFYPTQGEIDQAWREMTGNGCGTVCVLVDTGSTETKWWPYMGELAQQLVDACDDLQIIVLGKTKTQFPDHPRIKVLGTSRPWRIAATIAKEADLVIGQETGLLNVVAFEENHKVVLLTHSTVKNLTRDWVNTQAIAAEHLTCYPCHILHFAGFNRCVKDAERGCAMCQSEIRVEWVLDAARRALEESSVPA